MSKHCFPSTSAVNAVLATIAPGWSLSYDERSSRSQIGLRYGEGFVLAKLRSSDRLWLAGHPAIRRWGGTVEQAICQLILWHRDQPRRPLAWWRCAAKFGLGTPDTIRMLSDDEPGCYADPRRIGCVLCGAPEPSDWWALGKVIGPCCFGGLCQQRKETSA